MKITYSLLLATASVFATNSSYATQLHCTGRGWVERGPGFEDSAIVVLEKDRSAMKVILNRGTASGPVVADEKSYKGNLNFSGGRSVFVNLDRFSGELLVAPDGEGIILFSGHCEAATPKF